MSERDISKSTSNSGIAGGHGKVQYPVKLNRLILELRDKSDRK